MRLLVTRPAEDAARTAARLEALGHTAILAPLAEPLILPPPDLSEPPSALLLTSANAVRALAAWDRVAAWRALPVLTVGDRTAEAAREAGFSDVESAAGDAAALIARAERRLAGRPGVALWPAAEEPAADLVAPLGAAGIPVRRVPAYRMAAADILPAAIADLWRAGALDGVLLYSPASAARFGALLAAAGLAFPPVAAYVLSEAVGAAARGAGAKTVHVAAAANEAALLALLPRTAPS
ncbi:uroporphyrinogen-III synthase [Prosthecomicrobium pneumaticum]|uniref:Uroporphyrinogen-III synthase n=1 Tax=Prosthecomicrobium pneumaticum TaxID=81895 RepID=A0A7W9FN94_9HYPH|nr:uroporphyrinogen-III synthase [Prosthecomicrobium pneumaticum]MBB5753766.1 uroporphyrinogen-III synthase [Prosthecomicrobium pneumaticum]